MWREPLGTPRQYAGASGTVTLTAGAFITLIVVHSTAGGTVSILGGPSIPVIANAAPMVIPFLNDTMQANANSATVVFTGTDSYYVHACGPGNT